jgi:hypothetical protein
MGRQPNPRMLLCVITPPSRGPAMEAMPISAPNIPKAALRSRAGKETWMTESTWGYMSAAVRPCRTRDTTSISGV